VQSFKEKEKENIKFRHSSSLIGSNNSNNNFNFYLRVIYRRRTLQTQEISCAVFDDGRTVLLLLLLDLNLMDELPESLVEFVAVIGIL
jgi:hypothetical protein